MTTSTTTAYRVVAAAVTVKCERGSHGIFYEGDTLRLWDAGDGGTDQASHTETTRLADLGFIEPVNP
jgi:hypothetical protein